MEQTKEELEREIEKTTQSLRNKIETLEQTTFETIDSVTQGVKATAETIQNGVESLSIKHQVEKRPGTVLAASVGAGLLTGLSLGRRTKQVATVANVATGGIGRMIVVSLAQALLPIVVETGVRLAKDFAAKRLPAPPDQKPL